ncbi:MAG: hypothetical protein AAF985_26295, partial [Bacteroidota bacterium]
MFSNRIRVLFLDLIVLLTVLTTWQCKTYPSQNPPFTCVLPASIDTITNDCESNYTCTMEALMHSAIQVESNQSVINQLSIVRGKQTVFKIERTYQDHPAIADDEFSESIHFSIDPKVKSFSFDQNNLISSGLTYGIRAYSRDRGYHIIDNGCLEGQLTKDGWQIQLHFSQLLRTGTTIKKSIRAV